VSVFREAITDTDGIVDVSYLALFWVLVSVLGAITFVCVMTLVAFLRCSSNCAFDPQPLGIAVGAICTGFATALGALAGYMAATRHDRRDRVPSSD
jgi:hypothetical protein